MHQEGFTQGQASFSDSGTGALDHDPVLGDETVVWESTHWGDGFGGEVEFGGGAVG